MAKQLYNQCEATTSGNMESVTGPHFAVTGTPTYAAGKFNNGARIPTRSDVLKATLTSAFKTGAGTLAWYMSTSFAVANGAAPNLSALWNMGRASDAGAVPGIFLWLHSSSTYSMAISSATTGANTTAYSGSDAGIAWDANTWHHHALTWDYSLGSNNFKYYLDNVLEHQWTVTMTDDSLNGRYFWLGYGQTDWDIHQDIKFDAINFLDTVETDFSNYVLYEDGVVPAASNTYQIINC